MKPIDASLSVSRHFLNAMALMQSMSCCWGEFHASLPSTLAFYNLGWVISCPGVCVEYETDHWSSFVHSENSQPRGPVTPLLQVTTSPEIRVFEWYGNCFKPGIIIVVWRPSRDTIQNSKCDLIQVICRDEARTTSRLF